MANKLNTKAIDKYLLDEVGYDLETIKFILDNVSKVYCEITNGKLSYPNYESSVIIAEYEDCLNKIIEENNGK